MFWQQAKKAAETSNNVSAALVQHGFVLFEADITSLIEHGKQHIQDEFHPNAGVKIGDPPLLFMSRNRQDQPALLCQRTDSFLCHKDGKNGFFPEDGGTAYKAAV